MKICVGLSHTDGNMQYDKKDSVLRFKVLHNEQQKKFEQIQSKSYLVWKII